MSEGRPCSALPARVRVAEYLRMSTERQVYSPANQAAAIRHYADEHGMTVVRTYCDEGRSGLRLQGRQALQRLIEDVQTGGATYEAVLVFDVSRWGRFQNADESAFYEYLCLRHGVRVIYVTEPFDVDGSPLLAVLKGLKRSMAGEYSRELSEKVFAGQCRLVQAGFRMGGPPGYGLRRQLIDADGQPKMLLKHGERKAVMSDRVRIVPGPPVEVNIVRWIFRQSAAGVDNSAIMRALNRKGHLNQAGGPWKANAVRALLNDERYIGTLIFGRTTRAIGQRPGRRSPDREVRVEHAFPALVTPELFNRAKSMREVRCRKPTSDEMLDGLNRVRARNQRITSQLLNASPDTPTAQTYVRRFGSLRAAYRQIGYEPVRNLYYGEIRDKIRPWRRSVLTCLRDMLEEDGSVVSEDGWVLEVDGTWSLAVRLLQASHYHGIYRWEVRPTRRSVDILVAARMAADGSEPLDFILLPRVMADCWPQWLADPPSPAARFFVFPSLRIVSDLARLSRHVPE